MNLPYQTLPSSILPLYTLMSTARIQRAIFYCGKAKLPFNYSSKRIQTYFAGSSRHRGTTGAKLLEEIITAKGDDVLKSCILLDGIKGWARGGKEFVEFMDDYIEDLWQD